VLGRVGLDGEGSLGGALHDDLRQACYQALAVPRDHARLRALDFSWARAGELFAGHLVPARQQPVRAPRVDPVRTVTKPSSSG
jgi:hypothetical protein